MTMDWSTYRLAYADELNFGVLWYGLPFLSDTIHKPWETPLG